MLRVIDLRCEHAEQPLGIDVRNPRLSWRLESDRRGARQIAYRLITAATPADLALSQNLLWDSGRIESDQSVLVAYAGPALSSRQRVYWQVEVWDETNHSDASAADWWEMGLLSTSDWQAQWIGSDLAGGKWTTIPAPFVRRSFTLDRPITDARLYITALGLYDCSINGQRVGNDYFAPGWTEYATRVQYQTYTVTDLLHEGENVLGALLGDGWYCGHVEWRGRQRYGDRPKLLAQLELTFDDGSKQQIVSDGSWRFSFGPILESDMLMGESYDARRIMPGWDRPGFADSSWRPVLLFDEPTIQLSAPRGPAVRRQEELTPITAPAEIKMWPSSRWIFDFGQNLTGTVRLCLSGPAGTTVSLRYAEVLNTDGSIYTANLRSARQTDHYTLSGQGIETYEPLFTFHGFRYVELSGLTVEPTAETLTAIVLHSDTAPSGEFSCSDALINQLQHNIVWGQKGNFLDVPTDCPQRDERLGWTGDAQVFIRTATFNMDVAGFFTRWGRDLVDSQAESGAYPPISPNTGIVGSDGGPAWADAGVICPWTIWQRYGDTRILEEFYPSMQRFIEFLENTSRNLIRCYPGYDGWQGFGDWLALDNSGKTEGRTPHDLIGTAFFAHDARLMSDIAQVLGKTADVRRYTELAERVRQAFMDHYVTPEGLIAGQTQTGYVLALHFDLLPQQLRPKAVAELVRDIRKRGTHLATGFVGTPYLMHVLTEAGELGLAYELLHQRTWPSWLYSVTKGATTIWERWDGWTEERGFQDIGMNSFNHYAYGAVGDWLYAVVSGLDTSDEQTGYKQLVLRPRPGGGLTSARASYRTPYGQALSDWQIADGQFGWEVIVPPNSTAIVHVPCSEGANVLEGAVPASNAEGVIAQGYRNGAAVYQVGAGRYQFRVEN